jgi:hypothetical protein
MKPLLEYFGVFIFAFVVLVGGLIVLPGVTPMPRTSPDEILGLGLAFVVIAGGFSWYYLARAHQGTPGASARERPPRGAEGGRSGRRPAARRGRSAPS